MKNNGYSYKNLPPRELVEDLYINQHKTVQEVAEFFGVVPYTMGSWLKKMGITKTKKQVAQDLKLYNMRVYGVLNKSNLPDSVQKCRETCLQRYGTDHPMKCAVVKEKSKFNRKQSIERQGVSTVDKWRNTIQSKYGSFENYLRIMTSKREETCLQKFGVKNVFDSDEWQKIAKERHIQKHGALNDSLLNNFTEEQRHIIQDPILLKEFILSLPCRTPLYVARCLGYTCGVAGSIIREKCENFGIIDVLDMNPFRSGLEQEVFDFIQSVYSGVIIRQTKKIISPLELDIYLPELNFAVEFNGDYWHCEEQVGKNYHINKTKACKEKGIFLYHIFEYEWLDNRKNEIIKSQLLNILGKSLTVYARSTHISEISKQECCLFLEENHLQGKDKSSVRLGLYLDNLLVEVMTFGKPRFNHNYEYELLRLCTRKGYNVAGGCSKLWSYFIKNYNPQNVLSYCSLSKGTGKVYSILGMNLLRYTPPSYVWCKNNGNSKDSILTRYQCQMKKEVQTMRGRGYFRIFDCGNCVWEYTEHLKNIGV